VGRGSYFIGFDFKAFIFLEIDLGKQWDQFERLKKRKGVE
jgi:hypothetical protein